MSEKNNNRRGFIKNIILIVIALVVLGYFGYNIEDIVKSPTVQRNLNYVWGLATGFWNNFLVGPANFIWNKIIVGIVWEGIQKLLQNSNVPTQ